MRDIGKNIKALRKKKGMTQEALAEALFVTRQTVSNYETGRSRPDLDMLVSTLVAGLLRPALWLVLGWCVLQGLFLLQVIRLPEERAWVTWVRRGVLLVLAVYVVLLLPPMVVGLIQVIQACLGVPNEALVEFPQLPAYTWLMNQLLRFTAFTPQGCALIGGALWMLHFPKH